MSAVLESNDPRPGQASTLFYRLLDKLLPRLRRHLPYTRFFDNLYHRLLFLKKHHRFPKQQMMWNDVWFQIKTSGEIENPLRVYVSDKEQVKDYVRQTIGEKYNVPTIAVLRSPGEVDSFDFPARCAIKPTHASTHVLPARQRRAHRPRAHQEVVCAELLPLGARAQLPLAAAEGDRRAADLRHHECRGLQDLLLARHAQVRDGRYRPAHSSTRARSSTRSGTSRTSP